MALGDGRILASAADYDEVKAAVQELHPVPVFYLIFPAENEPPFEPYDSTYFEPYLS